MDSIGGFHWWGRLLKGRLIVASNFLSCPGFSTLSQHERPHSDPLSSCVPATQGIKQSCAPVGKMLELYQIHPMDSNGCRGCALHHWSINQRENDTFNSRDHWPFGSRCWNAQGTMSDVRVEKITSAVSLAWDDWVYGIQPSHEKIQ